MSIGPFGINFSEILIEINKFSFKKMRLKMSGKWWPFCLGLNVLIGIAQYMYYSNPQQSTNPYISRRH